MIHNDFDGYLEKYIEGYLFNDLKTIILLDPEANNHTGNLAYLLTIALLSAMEFIGVLLQERSPIEDGKVNASTGLAHYIKHYLSKIDPKYEALVEIAPRLIRNGIAHAYSTKGNVAITRVNTRDRSHLIRYTKDDILVINSNYLYEDFIKSYQELVKPRIQPDGDMYRRASRNYELIRNVYKAEVTRTSNESRALLNKYIPWEFAELPASNDDSDSLVLELEANGEPILIS